MAAQWSRFATFVVVVFLTLNSAFSADPLKPSPSPAPEVGADEKISSPPVKSPASSPDIGSPPAPPPTAKSSGSPSPSPAPETSLSPTTPSPSPSLPPAADSDEDEDSPSPAPSVISRAADFVASDTPEKKSSGGMNAGKKAGIALGVLVGVGVVVVAGIIYKKRQNNIQRSQYGYATRTGLI